ncbi:MAG: lytic murein transglycosylase [Candidatus Liptonbacteria bacterium]|nr:lytic murein transglycosylase [Candidatus Liptonbacteria bacterium]
MRKDTRNFCFARKTRRQPKVLSDIQFPEGSVYSALPGRLNLSFRAKKKFPVLELFKTCVVLAIVAVLILGHTTAPTTQTLAANATSEAERQALEAQLKELESQIGVYQGQISAYQKQGSSLKGEIGKLNAKIAKMNLEIKEGEYKLKQLSYQMADNQAKIVDTQNNIETQKANLSAILRNLYETGQTNIISVFLQSQKFSDFFNNINSLTSLQDSLRLTINQITDLKLRLEDEQEQLGIARYDTEALKIYNEQQKQETDKTKADKNQLLTATKGQESKYQELVKKTKETAAQVRSRIFQLLGGGEMSFGDAYKLAKLASDATGVRPAFILAILDRESALGQNVGKCTYKTAPMSQKKVKRSDGSLKSEVDFFLGLTGELGFQNAEAVSVSCHNADGTYGGAMGPAQFMPSTWAGYSAQISAVTGRVPASPWNNGDAFAAAALYLKDSGAATSERTAAARYYCGGNWRRYVCTNVYAKKVIDQAALFEDDVATLIQ